ncbi:protein of unknown function [Pararobbsia alpina]
MSSNGFTGEQFEEGVGKARWRMRHARWSTMIRGGGACRAGNYTCAAHRIEAHAAAARLPAQGLCVKAARARSACRTQDARWYD